jgi:opacity protein-like surface antigen
MNIRKLSQSTVSIFAISAFACSMFAGTAAFADHHKGKGGNLYLVPEIGYVLPVDGEVDDTLFLGGILGYQIDENLAVELESGWAQYEIDFADELKDKELDLVPILVNLKYSDCAWDDVRWYVYGGIGSSLVNLDGRVDGTNSDDNFAWQVGTGLENPVDHGLSLVFDLRYQYTDPSISTKTYGADGITTDSVFFNFGVKFSV